MLRINFFFSSRRRHTRWNCDWSSDVCSSDLKRCDMDLQSRFYFEWQGSREDMSEPCQIHLEPVRPHEFSPSQVLQPSGNEINLHAERRDEFMFLVRVPSPSRY